MRCVVNVRASIPSRGVDQLGKYMAENGVVYYDDDEELQVEDVMVDTQYRMFTGCTMRNYGEVPSLGVEMDGQRRVRGRT